MFGQLYGTCGNPGDGCNGGYTLMDGRFDVEWVAGMSNMLYTCAPTLSITPPPGLAEGGDGLRISRPREQLHLVRLL